jgi:hypothetical protein
MHEVALIKTCSFCLSALCFVCYVLRRYLLTFYDLPLWRTMWSKCTTLSRKRRRPIEERWGLLVYWLHVWLESIVHLHQRLILLTLVGEEWLKLLWARWLPPKTIRLLMMRVYTSHRYKSGTMETEVITWEPIAIDTVQLYGKEERKQSRKRLLNV